jgi:hypothetical protein
MLLNVHIPLLVLITVVATSMMHAVYHVNQNVVAGPQQWVTRERFVDVSCARIQCHSSVHYNVSSSYVIVCRLSLSCNVVDADERFGGSLLDPVPGIPLRRL